MEIYMCKHIAYTIVLVGRIIQSCPFRLFSWWAEATNCHWGRSNCPFLPEKNSKTTKGSENSGMSISIRKEFCSGTQYIILLCIFLQSLGDVGGQSMLP